MKRLALCLIVLFAASPSVAADVTDATGRNVTTAHRIDGVLPAGPPAAGLLTAIAPRPITGFSMPIAEPAGAALAPAATGLPQVPRLTAQPDATAAIRPLRADPIIDTGVTAVFSRLGWHVVLQTALGHSDPLVWRRFASLAGMFNTVVYGQILTRDQIL